MLFYNAVDTWVRIPCAHSLGFQAGFSGFTVDKNQRVSVAQTDQQKACQIRFWEPDKR